MVSFIGIMIIMKLELEIFHISVYGGGRTRQSTYGRTYLDLFSS